DGPQPARGRAAAALAALALAGCMVGPDYSRPGVPLPAQFPEWAEAPVAGTSVPVQPEWWRLYGDALLDDLVGATLAGNADLAQAVARIDEARAVLRQANAAFI